MDMQGFIDKYSVEYAKTMLRRFLEQDSVDTLYGRLFFSLNDEERDFLRSLPKGRVAQFDSKLGRWILLADVSFINGHAYAPAFDYTIPGTPDTQDKPEYFVGELQTMGLYSTPTGTEDWENETHDDILVSEYKEWAFLGFSWEDPRTEDDWNAEHFAHLTPFAKGDGDEVVMAPYAVWRKKGE